MDSESKPRSLEERADHDLLTRIDANLGNFMQKFEAHLVDDKGHFERLYARTSKLEKALWMALGALAVFEIAIKFWK